MGFIDATHSCFVVAVNYDVVCEPFFPHRKVAIRREDKVQTALKRLGIMLSKSWGDHADANQRSIR